MNERESELLMSLLTILSAHYEMFDDEEHEEVLSLINKLCPSALDKWR